MKEERMKILKMVEDGKISVDDATKLLESLKETYPFEMYEESEFNEKVKQFAKNAENFARDIGDKMGSFAKDMEPKVKKATGFVVGKTAAVVDEISKNLNEFLKNMNSGEKCCDDEPGENCGCGCGCEDEDRKN